MYRLFDAEGTLLYVGSAYDPAKRSRAHRDKPWWPKVDRREDEWHACREAAYVAETDAIREALPPGNKISGPGAVAAPAPKVRAATPLFALTEIDAYFDQMEAEPPAVRFRKVTALMEAVKVEVATRRRAAFEEMLATGMTYRQIAAELDISFGRVRQILAEGADQAKGDGS
ncbi:sigma factor-like helix-turn-helix DNA-binding protein [Streptomyces sp. NPDC096153]|uniref:sigma factor-like helix-turn-helix DNA-binding protein n=1 Tax=Streptomyces sp. NPDC096153 TaxID=3155548 RepID=UPI0033257EFA